jgi:hypothetical protein
MAASFPILAASALRSLAAFALRIDGGNDVFFHVSACGKAMTSPSAMPLLSKTVLIQSLERARRSASIWCDSAIRFLSYLKLSASMSAANALGFYKSREIIVVR